MPPRSTACPDQRTIRPRPTSTKPGVAGLVPQKRGPRGPHKLRGEVLAFVEQQLIAGEPVRVRELAKLIRQKFDLNIHPRTIERAVAEKKVSWAGGHKLQGRASDPFHAPRSRW